jgi:hypothetical protein
MIQQKVGWRQRLPGVVDDTAGRQVQADPGIDRFTELDNGAYNPTWQIIRSTVVWSS